MQEIQGHISRGCATKQPSAYHSGAGLMLFFKELNIMTLHQGLLFLFKDLDLEAIDVSLK